MSQANIFFHLQVLLYGTQVYKKKLDFKKENDHILQHSFFFFFLNFSPPCLLKTATDDEIGSHFGFWREMQIHTSWQLFTLDSKMFTSKSVSNVGNTEIILMMVNDAEDGSLNF